MGFRDLFEFEDELQSGKSIANSRQVTFECNICRDSTDTSIPSFGSFLALSQIFYFNNNRTGS